MRAAIYARKSTDQTGVSEDARSVSRQISQAREYAESRGWEVPESLVFSDDGISGAEFSERPGYISLMNSLTPEPRFGVLVLAEISRLGREQLATGYAVRQLSEAGVKIHSYLEGREIVLDSATDVFLLSAVNFASEVEREKARARTKDALRAKARKGWVVGGVCFGYRNVEVLGADGERSHVEREIKEDEARVVRRIFKLSAGGRGHTAIAKTLNAEGAPAPIPKRKGAPAGWAPSSVRSVLYRDLYRGVMIWNKTQKRDRWGQTNRSYRPESEHIEVPVPNCRIVSDAAWNAAHEALRSRSKAYLRHQDGKLWGRPPVGVESAYLLVGLAECGYCGGGMEVKSSSNGRGRKRSKFYCCSTYGRRGKAACKHRLKIPMVDADRAVLEAIEDALDTGVVVRAARKMLRAMREEKDAAPDLREQLRAKLAECEKAIGNLTTAIATGGGDAVPELAAAVKAQSEQRGRLEARLEDLDTPEPDEELTFAEVKATALEWREILSRDTLHARQILKKVLASKLRFKISTRSATEGFTFRGAGSIVKLVSGVVPIRRDSQPLASPTGFEPVLPA